MSISRQFSKLRMYKRALMLQRKASSLTPMERLIQRIATRVLKARFDEEQLDTVVMVSDRLTVGALLGMDAERSLNNREVEKTLSDLGGSTGIKWKALTVGALRGFRQVSESQMEDLIGKLYTDPEVSAAYLAARLVADPSVPVRDQLAQNTGAIASTFKTKVENLAKVLVKSNPYKLDRDTESMFDDEGGVIEPVMQSEVRSLGSYGDETSDADDFVNMIMFDDSRLAQNLREYVLRLIKDDLIGTFSSPKKPWSIGWATDMMADPNDGMFIQPPIWGKFKAAEYLREWVYTKVRTPQNFNEVAESVRGTYQAMVEGKNLVISGLSLGGAMGGGSISYLMTCAFDSADTLGRASGKYQSKIHNVYVRGSDLVIVDWKKHYGNATSNKVVISNIHYINMKREATYLADRLKKYPAFLESIFFHLLENRRVKKDLFAMMITSQTFSNTLQANLKKANEIRKNKHTNVPF